MEPQEKPRKMLNRDFVMILVITFFYGLNMNLVNPITAQYASTLGANETIMGIAVGVFSITALLVRPITGPLSNNCDKKKMLILAFGVYSAASFGYILFESIFNLMVMRFIHGFGVSLCSALLPTLACDYVPENKIGAAIGYFAMSQTIAMAVGPTITIYISDRFSYSVSFILAGLVALAALLLTTTLTKLHEEKGKLRFSFSDIISKKVVLPTVIHMVGAAVYSLISSFLVVYASTSRGISPDKIGWYFTTYALALIATRPLLSYIEHRVKEIYTIIVASILAIISMVILGFANNLFLFILSSIIMAFGFGITMPVLNALSVKLVEKENRAIANSTFNSGMDIGMGLGPVIGGLVASALGYSNMFLVFSAFEVLAIILAILFKDKLKSR